MTEGETQTALAEIALQLIAYEGRLRAKEAANSNRSQNCPLIEVSQDVASS